MYTITGALKNRNEVKKMNNNTKVVLSFICGAGVGFFAAAKLLNKRYSEQYEQELMDYKESHARQGDSVGTKIDFGVEVEDEYVEKATPYNTTTRKPPLSDFVARPEKEYVSYNKATSEFPQEDIPENPEEEDDEDDFDDSEFLDSPQQYSDEDNKVFIIDPAEFGVLTDYDQVTLTYYADGILAFEDNQIVEEVESTIRFDSLNHFGEYEADAVHVRNDFHQTDYEILQSTARYTDIVGLSS